MTGLIDLDATDRDVTPASAPALPARIWLRAWMPHHAVATGAAVGVFVFVVAALAWLTVLAVRPEPPAAPVAPASRIVSVVTENAAQETSTVIRRDIKGDSVSRGEIFGAEPSVIEQLAGIAVTVAGPNATCTIMIDGRVADQATVSPDGGQATCLWIAPTR